MEGVVGQAAVGVERSRSWSGKDHVKLSALVDLHLFCEFVTTAIAICGELDTHAL